MPTVWCIFVLVSPHFKKKISTHIILVDWVCGFSFYFDVNEFLGISVTRVLDCSYC